MGRAEPRTLLILPMSEVGSVSNSAADQASWRWRKRRWRGSRNGGFSQAARGLSYFFNIKTAALTDTVIKVAQFVDKGCHTVNSMRKRMPVAGKIILNERVCDRRLT
jgi:hypothetical protein